MGSLTNLEVRQLEKVLGMASGYVLEFSNKTIGDFFLDILGINLLDERFERGTNSKANRMRSFWAQADDAQIAKLLDALCDHSGVYGGGDMTSVQIETVRAVARRLRAASEPNSVSPGVRRLEEIEFQIGLTFPGTDREFVASVHDHLREKLGADAVFYDREYQAQLARMNLDVTLLNVYHKQCRLIVPFLSSGYEKSDWCGLEWRAVRDIIKSQDDDRVMLIRREDTQMPGMLSIDGYLDAEGLDPRAVAEQILLRLATLR